MSRGAIGHLIDEALQRFYESEAGKLVAPSAGEATLISYWGRELTFAITLELLPHAGDDESIRKERVSRRHRVHCAVIKSFTDVFVDADAGGPGSVPMPKLSIVIS